MRHDFTWPPWSLERDLPATVQYTSKRGDPPPLWWVENQATPAGERARRMRDEHLKAISHGLAGRWEQRRQLEREMKRAERSAAAVEELTSYRYIEVNAEDVLPSTRRAAERMLKACAPPWPVTIRWCRAETREEAFAAKDLALRREPGFRHEVKLAGMAAHLGSEVWVRAGLDPRDAAFVVAHEVRHTRQFPGLLAREEAERDADEYAARMVAALT